MVTVVVVRHTNRLHQILRHALQQDRRASICWLHCSPQKLKHRATYTNLEDHIKSIATETHEEERKPVQSLRKKNRAKKVNFQLMLISYYTVKRLL